MLAQLDPRPGDGCRAWFRGRASAPPRRPRPRSVVRRGGDARQPDLDLLLVDGVAAGAAACSSRMNSSARAAPDSFPTAFGHSFQAPGIEMSQQGLAKRGAVSRLAPPHGRGHPRRPLALDLLEVPGPRRHRAPPGARCRSSAQPGDRAPRARSSGSPLVRRRRAPSSKILRPEHFLERSVLLTNPGTRVWPAGDERCSGAGRPARPPGRRRSRSGRGRTEDRIASARTTEVTAPVPPSSRLPRVWCRGLRCPNGPVAIPKTGCGASTESRGSFLQVGQRLTSAALSFTPPGRSCDAAATGSPATAPAFLSTFVLIPRVEIVLLAVGARLLERRVVIGVSMPPGRITLAPGSRAVHIPWLCLVLIVTAAPAVSYTK